MTYYFYMLGLQIRNRSISSVSQTNCSVPATYHFVVYHFELTVRLSSSAILKTSPVIPKKKKMPTGHPLLVRGFNLVIVPWLRIDLENNRAD